MFLRMHEDVLIEKVHVVGFVFLYMYKWSKLYVTSLDYGGYLDLTELFVCYCDQHTLLFLIIHILIVYGCIMALMVYTVIFEFLNNKA